MFGRSHAARATPAKGERVRSPYLYPGASEPQRITKPPEKQALPANSPVASQDVVFNFLLLLFIHIWDPIFEKLDGEQGD